jgi:hypothetical protein
VPEKALAGNRQLVSEVLADLQANVEPVPERGVSRTRCILHLKAQDISIEHKP